MSLAARDGLTPEGITAKEQRVLGHLHRAGARGAIGDEISASEDMANNEVSPRLDGLRQKGLIERDGRTRKTRKGKSAYVWVLAQFVPASAGQDGGPTQ
jgi:DNA-binding MarR family transcriptional regulator